MDDFSEFQFALLIITLGVVLLIFLVMNAVFKKMHLPPLVGYILLGWVVRLIGERFQVLHENTIFTFDLLSKIGITLLLFHIGIETKLKKLVEVIGKAGFVSIIEIGLSGIIAFGASSLFGLSFLASTIIALAMTATSIGVSTFSWREKDLTEKKEGAFLLDLASLDDIISIILLTVLFGLLSNQFQDKGGLFTFVVLFFLKLALFITGCYLFSHFAEKKLMTELIHYEKMPDSMLSVVGIGLVIAGFASLIHFSLVIGGFFAGIAFSRDSRAVRIDASMKALLDFFVPFFFFWIGFQITLSLTSGGWWLVAALFFSAVIGKILGVGLPSWLLKVPGAFLVALSMIPRAEVTMVVMEHGREFNWVTSEEFSAVSIVVLATCLVTPYFIQLIFKKKH